MSEHDLDEAIAEVSHQHTLLGQLQDMTEAELAACYCQYMDDLSLALLEGFMEEVYRRGLSLIDLEDYCS